MNCAKKSHILEIKQMQRFFAHFTLSRRARFLAQFILSAANGLGMAAKGSERRRPMNFPP
jgi:hypothetical protein